nr:hypothetical protein [Tanacetum cinerariifolium]
HLEEIHVTWTQFEKKQTRLQLYTKIDEELVYRPWRRRHNSCDDVNAFKGRRQNYIDDVKVTDSEKPEEDSTGRRRLMRSS